MRFLRYGVRTIRYLDLTLLSNLDLDSRSRSLESRSQTRVLETSTFVSIMEVVSMHEVGVGRALEGSSFVCPSSI